MFLNPKYFSHLSLCDLSIFDSNDQNLPLKLLYFSVFLSSSSQPFNVEVPKALSRPNFLLQILPEGDFNYQTVCRSLPILQVKYRPLLSAPSGCIQLPVQNLLLGTWQSPKLNILTANLRDFLPVLVLHFCVIKYLNIDSSIKISIF